MRPGRAGPGSGPCAPAAPSLLKAKGLAKEPLTAKLDVVAKFAGKLPAEPGGIFTGNAMLPTDPSGRGFLAGQKFWAEAQRHEVVAQGPLLGVASRSPFFDAGDAVACHREV